MAQSPLPAHTSHETYSPQYTSHSTGSVSAPDELVRNHMHARGMHRAAARAPAANRHAETRHHNELPLANVPIHLDQKFPHETGLPHVAVENGNLPLVVAGRRGGQL